MRLFFLLSLIFTASTTAQTQYEFIDSERLGNRAIKIQLPRNYQENSAQFYPLIVVLDGDYLFETIAGTTDYMAYWGDMPETIVVGINQDSTRNEDLFLSDEDHFPIDSGAKFYEFLGAELVPYMVEKYRVGRFKVVVGHGETANFINFMSFVKKPLFQAYIAMSPTLSPFMSENLSKRLPEINTPLFYYMATAAEDFKDNRKTILNLNQKLNAQEFKAIFYKFDDFEAQNHYSLVSSAIPSALEHVFGIYQPISRAEYKTKMLTLESSAVDYLSEKYDRIDKLFGIEKQIILNDFRATAAALNKNENFSYYKDLAKLARKHYPESLLSNFYLGRFYEGSGQRRKAIKAYQEAFVYDEIDGISKEDMLDNAERLKAESEN